MSSNILFLTLRVFSATGGIETVCKVAGKAMYEMNVISGNKAAIYCMHDKQEDAIDNKYFPTEMFHGFGGARVRFISAALKESKKYDVVVLSHINLVLIGWLIKLFSPSTKLVLIAHGIEVWSLPGKRKVGMMHSCDQIFSVSKYTSEKIQELHKVSASKCRVLNNCLDPFLPMPEPGSHSDLLRTRYGYKKTDQVLFTLTRLSSKERYKGYDKVLEAMVALRNTHPQIHYLIAGSYDQAEKIHLDKLIQKNGLGAHVKLAGYVPEEELVAHFNLADIYVMPSVKEGFGIVFIEAMYYGLPVIAGNKDGSVDALLNGKLGILVDPDDTDSLRDAIIKMLRDKNAYAPDRELLMAHFSYDQYKRNLERLIANLN